LKGKVGFPGQIRDRLLRQTRSKRHRAGPCNNPIDAHGLQSRFAFARNGPAISPDAFKHALAEAGVQAATSATVLCGGDAGLWRLKPKRAPWVLLVTWPKVADVRVVPQCLLHWCIHAMK